MPTAEDEVRQLFSDAEDCPDPNSFPEGSSQRIIAKASRKLFADDDLRDALWHLLVVHPSSFLVRPPVLMLHRAIHEDMLRASTSSSSR